ncbi:MAG: acid phosphatase AphA, partial [Enterobacterales bacterium]|nr:acid phosphatase AphA [Enterobacterales bacterium]
MRKIAVALSTLALVISLSPSAQAKVSTDTPLNAGVTVAQLAHQAPIHWVSVTQIENSLQGIPPIAVGFDIDDTVLFSSPGFYRGQKEFSPQDQSYLKDP